MPAFPSGMPLKSLAWVDHVIACTHETRLAALGALYAARGKALDALALPSCPLSVPLLAVPAWGPADIVPPTPPAIAPLLTASGGAAAFAAAVGSPGGGDAVRSPLAGPPAATGTALSPGGCGGEAAGRRPGTLFAGAASAIYRDSASLLAAALASYERARDYFQMVGDVVAGGRVALRMCGAHLARLFPGSALLQHSLTVLARLPDARASALIETRALPALAALEGPHCPPTVEVLAVPPLPTPRGANGPASSSGATPTSTPPPAPTGGAAAGSRDSGGWNACGTSDDEADGGGGLTAAANKRLLDDLGGIERLACAGLDAGACVADPLMLLEGLLHMAELRYLQGLTHCLLFPRGTHWHVAEQFDTFVRHPCPLGSSGYCMATQTRHTPPAIPSDASHGVGGMCAYGTRDNAHRAPGPRGGLLGRGSRHVLPPLHGRDALRGPAHGATRRAPAPVCPAAPPHSVLVLLRRRLH